MGAPNPLRPCRGSRTVALLTFGAATALARSAWPQAPGAPADPPASAPPASAPSASPPPSASAPPAASPVTPPVVLQHVDAVYPPSALATREHANVVLAVTVDADGHVSKVDVLESGGADLDEAAIVAVRQWTFVPALRDGKALASRIKIPFHFAPPAAPPEMVEPKASDRLPVQPSVPQAPAVPPAASSSAAAPASTAAATASPSEAGTTAEASQAVQEVDVRGHLDARQHGTSDYQVTLGEQKAIPRTNASDVLKLAPGFLLTNEGGSGHAEQVFLRGFDAHEGQDLEFTVDGVPINDAGNFHGNGYADTHFIIPELIHSVRVLEGPYAPQEGNFAVAGSADYQLGLDRRGLTAEYSAGSYGTQRLLLLWGPTDAPTGTFAGAEYYTTDGFGANRRARRGTGIGQVEIPVGQRGTLRLNTTAYLTEYDNAGVVRQDDFDAGKVGFFGTEDPAQTGNDSSRVSLSATYEGRFKDVDVSQQIFLVDRTMRLRENWTGFLLDVQEPTQQPHDQRGDLIDFHFSEVTAGARGFARWHGNVLGLRQEFEGGYFARFDQTHSTQDRIAAGSAAPYLIDADLDSTLGDLGVYIDSNLRLLPWLGFRGGVRADMFLFDVLNNCDVQSVDSPSKSATEVDLSCLSELEHGVYREPFQRSTTGNGAVMPRGTLVVGPLEHFELTASVGNGIRTVDPSYVSQGLVTPFVSVQSRDVGVAYNREVGSDVAIAAKSVFFQTHVDQDLIFDPTQGRNTLSSGSTRTGWSGSTRLLGRFYDLAANATLVKAVFDDTGTCAPACGLLVPYIPDLVLRGDFVFFHDLPFSLAHQPVRATAGYGVSYVGHRPLPYGDVSDAIFLSDASVSVGWTIWNVRLSGQNIFDSRYRLGEYNYASDFHKLLPEPTLAPERAFTAGAPRTIMLSLSATLGGA
jgi:iron complex outermembrane recepter protein